ncbi:MAG: glycosyltransferase family 9 protein [Terrimicrobiaceae bacterium]|nr:glycosyltransferase family 9 protein [Terrimicrobiaceae bacterium]
MKLDQFMAWRLRAVLARCGRRSAGPIGEPRRVVCVLEGGVGDKILALPAVRHLRRRHPKARLTIQSVGILPVGFEAEADEIVLVGKSDLFRRIRTARCDELFVSSVGIFDVRNELVAALSGASVRRGPRHAAMRPGDTIYEPSYVFGAAHEAEVNLAGAGGAAGEALHCVFAESVLRRFRVMSSTPTIGLHVTCHPAARSKQWSHFRELQAHPALAGFRFVIVGTAAEEPVLRAAAGDRAQIVVCQNGEDFNRAVGATTVFVGNDSGLCHLAAALDVPTVVIMAATDPAKCAPRGRFVRVVSEPCERGFCYWTGAECLRCIDRITPDRVVREIVALVGSELRH